MNNEQGSKFDPKSIVSYATVASCMGAMVKSATNRPINMAEMAFLAVGIMGATGYEVYKSHRRKNRQPEVLQGEVISKPEEDEYVIEKSFEQQVREEKEIYAIRFFIDPTLASDELNQLTSNALVLNHIILSSETCAINTAKLSALKKVFEMNNQTNIRLENVSNLIHAINIARGFEMNGDYETCVWQLTKIYTALKNEERKFSGKVFLLTDKSKKVRSDLEFFKNLVSRVERLYPNLAKGTVWKDIHRKRIS